MHPRDVAHPAGPAADIAPIANPNRSPSARTPRWRANGRSHTAADHARSAVTWLLVPGDRPDRFQQAADSGADAVVIDLDGPATPADKAAARRFAVRYLSAGRPAYVQLNSPASAALFDDLAALASAGPALRGVILPQSEHPGHFAAIDKVLAAGAIAVALIRSPLGLVAAHKIARAPRVIRLAFGSAGFLAGTGTGTDGHQSELLAARSLLVLASGAERLSGPIDSPPAAPDDPARLVSEAETSLRLGFTGKFCLSSRQIHPVALGFGRCSGWPAQLQSGPAPRLVARRHDRIGAARSRWRATKSDSGLVLLDGWKDLCLPVLRLLEPKLAPGALIAADDITFADMAGCLDYIRDPANGYVTVAFPVEDGMEISSWTGR
jgi:citrate lyase subunit beta / citryl-CoA lyase